jgi:hypothetical protein
MGRGGSYEINEDGEEVLVEEPTRDAPEPDPSTPVPGFAAASPAESNTTEFPAFSANAETEFPLVAATPPIAAPGGKKGRGGPSPAASSTLPAYPATEDK